MTPKQHRWSSPSHPATENQGQQQPRCATRSPLHSSSEQCGKARPHPPLPAGAIRKALVQGLFMGGAGLEPAAPSLSRWCRRSHQFAGVRSGSMVERNSCRDRTLERTRTNADPCHFCHAFRDKLRVDSKRQPAFLRRGCEHGPQTSLDCHRVVPRVLFERVSGDGARGGAVRFSAHSRLRLTGRKGEE
jgi:hypothetical protein